MGLDMYLYRKNYVKNWDHTPMHEQHHVTVLKNGAPVPFIKPERVAYVLEQVMYWRKANAIHAWFVREVQEGNDDCGHYWLGEDKLHELVAACERVLEDRNAAASVLPVQQGFFFGGTDYDDYYFEEIARTRDLLKGVLAETDQEAFEYHSSW
jgi:hypothetical protein